jgi:hypothetical protein
MQGSENPARPEFRRRNRSSRSRAAPPRAAPGRPVCGRPVGARFRQGSVPARVCHGAGPGAPLEGSRPAPHGDPAGSGRRRLEGPANISRPPGLPPRDVVPVSGRAAAKNPEAHLRAVPAGSIRRGRLRRCHTPPLSQSDRTSCPGARIGRGRNRPRKRGATASRRGRPCPRGGPIRDRWMLVLTYRIPRTRTLGESARKRRIGRASELQGFKAPKRRDYFSEDGGRRSSRANGRPTNSMHNPLPLSNRRALHPGSPLFFCPRGPGANPSLFLVLAGRTGD